MSNPLMQMMSGASSAPNGMASLGNIVRMLRSGNPEQIAHQLMQQNPQFRAFVQAERCKLLDPLGGQQTLLGTFEVKCKLGYEVSGTIHVIIAESK